MSTLEYEKYIEKFSVNSPLSFYINYEHTLVKQGGRDSNGSKIGGINVIDNSSEKYLIRLDNYHKWFESDIIIDYSIPNIINVASINDYEKLSKKHLYIPALLYDSKFMFSTFDRNINTLTTFINTNEPRRASFLELMKNGHLNINNCFEGEKLRELYSQTKIVINIHQTDHHHTVEELRILPALLCGTIIVCEDSPLKENIPYKDFIVWEKFDAIIEKSCSILNDYNTFYSSFFSKNRCNELSEIVKIMKSKTLVDLNCKINLCLDLDKLSKKYSLDKNIFTGCHNYIPGYTQLFEKKRHTVNTLLEIGIGSVENGQMGGVLHLGYKTGNSLRCWRDYFSNATIYGIDLYQHSLQENRIETYIADQSNLTDLEKIVKIIGKEIDIIIDDGSHVDQHQAFSFMFLERFLSSTGIYVIEDIQPSAIEKFKDLSIFPDYFRSYIESKYTIKYFDTRHVLNRADDFMTAFIRK